MSNNSKVRVYIACSLDGFIAGPENDLSWLPQGEPEGPQNISDGCLEYNDFMSQIGAILMGRNTYDVVLGFGGDWPYGETPVLVATSRSLQSSADHVIPIQGAIAELIQQAKDHAHDKDVYLDGGDLIRQALAAQLVDELIVTMVPVVLGRGIPLFAGTQERQFLEFTGHYIYNGMVQLHARPKPKE